jgi:hypothetical protein
MQQIYGNYANKDFSFMAHRQGFGQAEKGIIEILNRHGNRRQTRGSKMSRRTVIGLGIACILLVAGLVGLMFFYNLQVNTLNNGKDTLTTQYNVYVSGHHYTDEQYASENASAYGLGYNVGFGEGNASGYNVGYQAGLTSRGFNIVDPTHQQMLSFMATDTVHNSVYSSTYVCWNFCNDYINEAFRAGWGCGFVYIAFPDSAHGVVCFNTTDRGILFVEPQSNVIVKVANGYSYWSSNGFTPATYNDTIVDFGIIW